MVVRDVGGATRAVPAVNAADRADRFDLSPAVLLGAHRRGERVLAFYHSHPDGPARMSAADQRAARLPDGPAWPGVDHLVLAVPRGRPAELTRHRWHPADGRFVPVHEDP